MKFTFPVSDVSHTSHTPTGIAATERESKNINWCSKIFFLGNLIIRLHQTLINVKHCCQSWPILKNNPAKVEDCLGPANNCLSLTKMSNMNNILF